MVVTGQGVARGKASWGRQGVWGGQKERGQRGKTLHTVVRTGPFFKRERKLGIAISV